MGLPVDEVIGKMAKAPEKVVFVSNEEQIKRGGRKTFYPKLNWPYKGDYNPGIHGTYDPAIRYGPPKTSIWDWKIGEIPWNIEKADKSFHNMMNIISRTWYKTSKRHCRCQHIPFRSVFMGIAILSTFQACMTTGLFMSNGGATKAAVWKYHW